MLPTTPRPRRRSARSARVAGATGPFFVLAGVLHFAKPTTYESMVPDWLPARRALVYASGLAEVAGGVGLTVRDARARRMSGWWLATTLVAVFPANVHMARHSERFAVTRAGRIALHARLPLQAVFIAWVLAAGTAETDAQTAKGPLRDLSERLLRR